MGERHVLVAHMKRSDMRGMDPDIASLIRATAACGMDEPCTKLRSFPRKRESRTKCTVRNFLRTGPPLSRG